MNNPLDNTSTNTQHVESLYSEQIQCICTRPKGCTCSIKKLTLRPSCEATAKTTRGVRAGLSLCFLNNSVPSSSKKTTWAYPIWSFDDNVSVKWQLFTSLFLLERRSLRSCCGVLHQHCRIQRWWNNRKKSPNSANVYYEVTFAVVVSKASCERTKAKTIATAKITPEKQSSDLFNEGK